VDISDQFQKIRIFLANNRFVPILEKVTTPALAQVKINSVTRKQAPHKRGEFRLSWPKEKMEMIGKQGPGKTINIHFL
jgi:hypothetical protein